MIRPEEAALLDARADARTVVRPDARARRRLAAPAPASATRMRAWQFDAARAAAGRRADRPRAARRDRVAGRSWRADAAAGRPAALPGGRHGRRLARGGGGAQRDAHGHAGRGRPGPRRRPAEPHRDAGRGPGGRHRDGPGGVHRGRPRGAPSRRRTTPIAPGRRRGRRVDGAPCWSRPSSRARWCWSRRSRPGRGRRAASGRPPSSRAPDLVMRVTGVAGAVVGPAVAMKLRRPAIVGVLLAVLLTVLAAVGPPAAGPIAPFLAAIDAPVALAADDLGVTTKARYVVVPQNGVIRVAVDVAVVNQKPNRVSGGVITRYFYDSVNLGVQLEATHLRATQDGAPVRVTSAVRRGFRLVTISFRNDIYVGETAHVRLQFDLPAGAPRSDSDVRVGPAFATFLAWAFGDRGSVRIDVPKAFDVDISGEDMEASTTADLEGVHGDDRRRARLVRLGQRPQRRRAHARAAGPRRRRAGRRPRLARGLALAPPGVGDPLRQRARPRRPDRPPVAGRRPAQRARGPHAAARGLRRLLRPQERRDHDQREPRRPDHRPRGLARLVQQPPVHRPLDQRGAGRGVRVAGARGGDARQGRPGAGQALRQGRVPARALGPARADPRRAERRPRAVRVRRRLDR